MRHKRNDLTNCDWLMQTFDSFNWLSTVSGSDHVGSCRSHSDHAKVALSSTQRGTCTCGILVSWIYSNKINQGVKLSSLWFFFIFSKIWLPISNSKWKLPWWKLFSTDIPTIQLLFPFNPIRAGGWISPHFFQMAISPWKKGSGGPKFHDFS